METNTSTYVIGGGSGPNIEEVLPDVGGGGGELPTGYSIYYHINGYGTQPGTRYYQTALPKPLPTLTANGVIFEGWYTDSNLTAKAVAGAAISADAHLYAKWTTPAALGSFNIQKGALPTWHDLYIKDSQELVDLNDIAVTVTESDVSTYGYSCSSDYYKTTSWLCADSQTVISKAVPTIPKYQMTGLRGIVFNGCHLNTKTPEGSEAVLCPITNSGILTRTKDGQLLFSYSSATAVETIISNNAPYYIYFELAGAGGGGGASGSINGGQDGASGGSGAAIAGVLDFTKQSAYQIKLGNGGNGGTAGLTSGTAMAGTSSTITASDFVISVPGGKGGQNSGYTVGVGGGAAKYFYANQEEYAGTLRIRYYTESNIYILSITQGQAGFEGDYATYGGYAGDGGSVPMLNPDTLNSFGTRKIISQTFGCSDLGWGGSGGIHGPSLDPDVEPGTGGDANYGGGGGGAGYRGAYAGGRGGNGICILYFWDNT